MNRFCFKTGESIARFNRKVILTKSLFSAEDLLGNCVSNELMCQKKARRLRRAWVNNNYADSRSSVGADCFATSKTVTEVSLGNVVTAAERLLMISSPPGDIFTHQ